MPRTPDPVVLLTGATDGLGRAAAVALAGSSVRLTLVGRDATKTEHLARQLRASNGNASVDTLIADLSTLEGMRHVADGFASRHSSLDVLINNVGGFFERPCATVDGFEETFALNHLSWFVLTTRLAPQLRATPGARVVNTSSTAYRFGRGDFERAALRVGKANLAAGMRAYCESKLANVVFTRDLSRRLAGEDVVVNCLHPGFLRSGLFRQTTGVAACALRNPLSMRLARSPERGADTLVWLATSEVAGSFTGRYVVDCTVTPVVRHARDVALGERLWQLSERLAVQGNPDGITAR